MLLNIMCRESHVLKTTLFGLRCDLLVFADFTATDTFICPLYCMLSCKMHDFFFLALNIYCMTSNLSHVLPAD